MQYPCFARYANLFGTDNANLWDAFNGVSQQSQVMCSFYEYRNRKLNVWTIYLGYRISLIFFFLYTFFNGKVKRYVWILSE